MTLTLAHPRYLEFLDLLSGPNGLDLQPDGSYDCAHGTDKTHATNALRTMGFGDAEIASTLAYFEARGGFCDHEILLDVEPTAADQITDQEG